MLQPGSHRPFQAATGVDGSRGFPRNGFVEPRWLRQLLTTTEASKQGTLSWVFWDVLELRGLRVAKKTYWEWQQNRPKFSFIYIHILM